MTDKSAAAKQPINDWLFEQTKGQVQSGPFKDMLLLKDEFWKDGNLSTKLLGCYEEELHTDIQQEIDRLSKLEHPEIANVGCAEGYYAIGMQLCVPNARVFAVDISEEAFAILHKTEELNGIKPDTILTKIPILAVLEKPDLVIMDCEGYEMVYLDLQKFPGLAKSTIIVECHDCPDVPITPRLKDRFKDTHTIANIIEGARNPNKFEMLHGLHSLDRWLAVSEGRPVMMNWLVMRPK